MLTGWKTDAPGEKLASASVAEDIRIKLNEHISCFEGSRKLAGFLILHFMSKVNKVISF